MSDLSFSAMLRDLSKDYYQNHIALEEYRTQRKNILDKIDEEFNGRRQQNDPSDDSSDSSEDSSVFMKTIAFFKNSDIDE